MLFIFLLVVCFHDCVEYKNPLNFKTNPKCLIVSHHSHFDDAFELPADANAPVSPVSHLIIESSLNMPKENYTPIWKPPAIPLS